MLSAVSIMVLSLMLQEGSSQQPKVTEKLEINCKTIKNASKPSQVETADEKAARHAADFEKALMQMDKCLNKVAVSASGAGGGGAGSNGSSGDGSGSGASAPGALQGTDQEATQSADSNGAPNDMDPRPNNQTAPAPSKNSIPDTPADIPSKANDDVVAQQLRELAEQEPDPELKKKYWNQYRKYKGLKEID